MSAAGFGADSLCRGLKRAERIFAAAKRIELDIAVTVGEAGDECFASHDCEELDSSTGRLCLAAASECLLDARSRGAGVADGLIVGTSTGGQFQNEEAVFSLLKNNGLGDFDYRGRGCMAAPSRLVARTLQIEGPVQTVSTACTSSANAIALGAAWVGNGRAKRVLAGGGDALCRTTICGFLGLELTGTEMCAPFGRNRLGMTIGEGAGFLLLERLDDVRSEGRPYLAELLGFGMSSDAHHMTAPREDGAGAEQAMCRALNSAGLSPGGVDHINAHGTGTLLNDASEAAAVNRIFGAKVPVMSCKGLIGHTLGGSGALEAVACVLAIKEKRAFENVGADLPAEDCPISLTPPGGLELPDRPVILSNSFAFGGNNCALLFGAP